MTFQIEKLNKSEERIYQIYLKKEHTQEYLNKVKDISVRDMENIPFFRFLAARDFESIFNIQNVILPILKDYETGAILIDCNTADDNAHIKLSTAISYLLGNPCIDPLSGKYYAIFTIQHTTEQMPVLYRTYEQFMLHTDGAYMKQVPEWIFFMKIKENSSIGGQTKLLHIDDWEHFYKFYYNKLNIKFNFFENPGTNLSVPRYSSNQDISGISAPLLNIEENQKSIRFVDRFIYPSNIDEADFIYQFQQSLERSTKATTLNIPIGSLLLINNRFWLHGRMPFEKNKNLSRSLMRQRGYFL